MSTGNRGLTRLVFVVFLMITGGCAEKAPLITPIVGEPDKLALARFEYFLEQDCPKAIDVDISLNHQMLGNTVLTQGI